MSRVNLPHQPPYRFVTAVEHADAQSARVVATAPAGASRLVEVAAQAAAVAHGTEAGQPRDGVLVGVRRFRIHTSPAEGSTLRVEATLRGALGDQALFRCRLSTAEGAPVADGDLALAAS